jgi:hypothetical protein
MKTHHPCHLRSQPKLKTSALGGPGWDIILEFAATKMSLPRGEKCLKEVFGTVYVASDWKPVINIVMDAEEDSAVA